MNVQRMDARAIMAEIMPMTFDQLCERLHVTADERDQLAWFLAMFRARKTYDTLRNPPCE